jgi:hypothetical protein
MYGIKKKSESSQLNFQEVLTEELVLTSRLFVLKIFAWSIGS